MKSLLPTLLCVLTFTTLHAADDARLKAITAADEARIAATQSPTREALGAIFSDDLRYAHSTGVVDTKATYTDTLMAGTLKYTGYDYEERTFTFPAPGIALMTGKARVKVVTPTGPMDNVLGFLAVWREEAGKWRFLAWQSAKLPVTKTP